MKYFFIIFFAFAGRRIPRVLGVIFVVKKNRLNEINAHTSNRTPAVPGDRRWINH